MTAIVIGASCCSQALRGQSTRRPALSALRRAKNTPIAELKHGEWARVTGVVSAAAPTLTSPIGEDECIGFRLEVTRPDQNILSTSSPVSTVLRRETCQPFSISDETGKAHVDGPFCSGARLRAPSSPYRSIATAFSKRPACRPPGSCSTGASPIERCCSGPAIESASSGSFSSNRIRPCRRRGFVRRRWSLASRARTISRSSSRGQQ